jgi:hypothetical protein
MELMSAFVSAVLPVETDAMRQNPSSGGLGLW